MSTTTGERRDIACRAAIFPRRAKWLSKAQSEEGGGKAITGGKNVSPNRKRWGGKSCYTRNSLLLGIRVGGKSERQCGKGGGERKPTKSACPQKPGVWKAQRSDTYGRDGLFAYGAKGGGNDFHTLQERNGPWRGPKPVGEGDTCRLSQCWCTMAECYFHKSRPGGTVGYMGKSELCSPKIREALQELKEESELVDLFLFGGRGMLEGWGATTKKSGLALREKV